MKKVIVLIMLLVMLASCGGEYDDISGIYEFHTATYIEQPDISDSYSHVICIGDIQLTIFKDGSAYLSVNGCIMQYDSGGYDAYSNDFSHNFYLQSSEYEQAFLKKLNSYANFRIRYKINTKTVSFKAVVDSDGDFSDTADTSFVLACTYGSLDN